MSDDFGKLGVLFVHVTGNHENCVFCSLCIIELDTKTTKKLYEVKARSEVEYGKL